MYFDDRINLNAFEGGTTYKNDYRKFSAGVINARRGPDKWAKIRKEEPKHLPPCETYQMVDHESFQPYKKGVHVPFDLLLKPIPIVQTNPRNVSPKFDESKYENRNKVEAIKTKSTPFLSPAIPLDDIKGPLKNLIIKHMYTTNLKMAQDEVAKYTRPITRDIFETSLDKGDPLAVCVDKYPPIPNEWRNANAEWDKRQKRGCVDSTKQFWLRTPLREEPYAKIKRLVPQEVKNEISELIDKDKLQNPHDIMKPHYTGYKPRLAAGVPLEKIDLPVVHPRVSFEQAIKIRYAE